MASVTWVFDSGAYLISSKEHLLMIMQLGTFTSNSVTYTAAGTVPSSYLSSDFRQTVDIDLEDDPNCYAIGRLTGTAFTGDYDGGGFSISNFTSSAGEAHGLFGYISGSTLKDITLSGTWNVTGNNNSDQSSALCAVTSGTCVIERIDINGTVVCTGTTDSYGTLISEITDDITVTDITVRGNVNGIGINYCGGVISHISGGTVVIKNLRYSATGDLEYTRNTGSNFNTSNAMGGVIGVVDAPVIATFSNFVNAMTGNMDAIVTIGGVIGMILITNAANFVCTHLVNGMTGNMTSSVGPAGGIFGRTYFGTTSYVMNVMKGDISASDPGGIGGIHFNGSCTNCILAMDGNINSTVTGSLQVGGFSGTISMEWVTSDFGLTMNSSPISDVLTKPAVSSPWGYHVDLPEVPYLEMSATDTEANVSYVATPFPNISGHSIYDSMYGYYSVGYDSTFFPVETTIGVSQNDYVLFKFDTVSLNVVDSQGLGISFVASPYSSIFIEIFAYIAYISWYGVNTSYDVSLTETGSSEEIQKESIGVTNTIVSLSPGTEYTFKIYGDGNLILTSNLFTSPVADGTSIGDMLTYLGNDLSTLGDTSIVGVLEYIGDALDTLDVVSAVVHVGETVSTKSLTFVDDGDTINISNLSSILTPFVSTGGSSQSITLELTDTSTEVVTYDESSDEITVASQTYSVGDTFILDGKKATVAALE